MKRTVELEQYFTTSDLARRCVEFTASLVELDQFELVVEPSAGAGAFYFLLPEKSRIGLDLEPRMPDISQADFLGWHPPGSPRRILTIGNPPFGQRAALAVAFIKHACCFSDVVAFILPRSFNKYTFQNRVPRNFHLLGSFDCNEFYGLDGQAQEIKTVFQVWQKRPESRSAIELASTHPHFDMRHCHLSRVKPGELEMLRASYEFAIPQVGGKFWPRSANEVIKGSHWFIKPNVAGVRDRFERLDFSFLDGMNTAHTSLSKKDIVAAYEAVLAQSGERAEWVPSSVPISATDSQLQLWDGA